MVDVRRPGPFSTCLLAPLLAVVLASCTSSHSCPPGGCEGDAKIKQQIDAMIYANRAIQPFSITVQVKEGVAYLYGIVDTQLQKNVIEEETVKIPGVKRVVNSISVRGNVY